MMARICLNCSLSATLSGIPDSAGSSLKIPRPWVRSLPALEGSTSGLEDRETPALTLPLCELSSRLRSANPVRVHLECPLPQSPGVSPRRVCCKAINIVRITTTPFSLNTLPPMMPRPPTARQKEERFWKRLGKEIVD
jgi:hypothetical protein